MAARLPELGRSGDEVLAELREMKGLDADWRHGRVPLYVFKANDEVDRVGREAFVTYFAENALGSKRAFLSLGRMEREVVEMGLGLFGAPTASRWDTLKARIKEHGLRNSLLIAIAISSTASSDHKAQGERSEISVGPPEPNRPWAL